MPSGMAIILLRTSYTVEVKLLQVLLKARKAFDSPSQRFLVLFVSTTGILVLEARRLRLPERDDSDQIYESRCGFISKISIKASSHS